MKRIGQFEMTDGDYVMIEIDEVGGGSSVIPAGRVGEVVDQAKVHFEDALHCVLPALKRVTATLRELQPDAFEIAFGIKFNTQVGAMIAAIASEANLTVTVKWNKDMDESAHTS
ncbi:MAG: hypothetical protein E6J34_15850 [Chloroflexi bacterium]|nr:MAG: hypothetical protein E6J34_15850 [Chloroflexota bacterium]